MAMTGNAALVLSQQYTEDSLVGMGALKGKNCTISNMAEDSDGNSLVTFKWVDDNNVEYEQTLTVKKGEKGDRGTFEFYENQFDSIEQMVSNKDKISIGLISIVTIDNVGYMFARVPGATTPGRPELDGFLPLGSFDDYVWANEANEVEYTNTSHPEVSNVEDALNQLYSKVFYEKPEIKNFICSPASGNREIGQVIEGITFSWFLNKDIVSQTLTGCTIEPNERTANYTSRLKTTKTFTLKVTDEEGESASKNLTFTFLPKIYYGASVEKESYDSAFILALSNGDLKSSKAGTYSLNVGADKFGYIAMPSSYSFNGVCKIGGFDTELEDCGVVSVTNASGHKQDYKLYKTTQTNLGNISMVIS